MAVVQIVCPRCKGKGIITKHGSVLVCAVCDGTGTVEESR